MSRIIKQPNGLYCLFSTITDDVIGYNLTKEDIIDYEVSVYRDRIEQDISFIIHSLETGERCMLQQPMSFEEMLKTIKSVHGSKRVKELKNSIDES